MNFLLKYLYRRICRVMSIFLVDGLHNVFVPIFIHYEKSRFMKNQDLCSLKKQCLCVDLTFLLLIFFFIFS